MLPGGSQGQLDSSLRDSGRRYARVALDLFRQLEQHVNLALVSAALDKARHHVCHPGRALAAGCALAARLVLVELREARDAGNDIGLLVHDDDGARAEAGAEVLERVVVHPVTAGEGRVSCQSGRAQPEVRGHAQCRLAVVLGHDRDGATAGDDAERGAQCQPLRKE